MKFSLAYGREHVEISLPDSCDTSVIQPGELAPAPDPCGALIHSLVEPVGSPPLREVVSDQSSVLIVVADKTRPCEYPLLLPELLDHLNGCGIPDSGITLLVAYGSHRRQSTQEDIDFYGKEALDRVRLVQHECEDEGQMVGLGNTSRGTPVRLNRLYSEHPCRITFGPLSFHYFAGFGGGRKLVFPGLGGRESILLNHRLYLGEKPGDGFHPGCRTMKLDGNPIHEDALEIVRTAEPSFAINVLLAESGGVSKVFSGDWLDSHRMACDVLGRTAVSVPRRFPLVIASPGGYPKDINLIQTHKTIHYAFDFLEPGGDMVVLARCEDGIGSDTFMKWFETPDREDMEAALHDRYDLNGGTALALRLKTLDARIHLLSDLDGDAVRKTGMLPVDDPQALVSRLPEGTSPGRVAVIPKGSVTVRAAPES